MALNKGLKRICMSCGARFYDLGKNPIICPACGTEFTGEIKVKSRRGRAAAELEDDEPVAVVEADDAPADMIEADEETVSLDDVEESDDSDDDDIETLDDDIDDLDDDMDEDIAEDEEDEEEDK